MENEIKKFVIVHSGDGSGFSSGFGFGDCSGDGSGFGYESADCFGDGFGDSFGSGSGFGFGSGDSFGNGSGNGNGSDLKSINGMYIHNINGIQTIITEINDNIARGFIVQPDLTLTPCWIIKDGNLFAHGSTLELARKALESNRSYSHPY